MVVPLRMSVYYLQSTAYYWQSTSNGPHIYVRTKNKSVHAVVSRRTFSLKDEIVCTVSGPPAYFRTESLKFLKYHSSCS